MDEQDKKIDVYLQPGEYFVGDACHRVRTLLGSCVSITLWHPTMRIGAISHFLLASRGKSDKPVNLDSRYGQEVMSLMIQELQYLEVDPRECLGKIFGGGDMFPGQTRAGMINVGRKNGEIARTLLRTHNIPIVSECLFGVGHRHIIFEIDSGDVWSRQVKPQPAMPAVLPQSQPMYDTQGYS